MKIYKEIGSLYIVNRKDAEGYERPVYEIDVDEIVECKDCKHNQLPPTRGNAECELWCGMTDLYGYCHYGERRGE